MATKEKLSLTVAGKVFKYDGLVKNRERDLWELVIRKSVPDDEVPATFRLNLPDEADLSDTEILERFNAHKESKAKKKGGTVASTSAETTPSKPPANPALEEIKPTPAATSTPPQAAASPPPASGAKPPAEEPAPWRKTETPTAEPKAPVAAPPATLVEAVKKHTDPEAGARSGTLSRPHASPGKPRSPRPSTSEDDAAAVLAKHKKEIEEMELAQQRRNEERLKEEQDRQAAHRAKLQQEASSKPAAPAPKSSPPPQQQQQQPSEVNPTPKKQQVSPTASVVPIPSPANVRSPPPVPSSGQTPKTDESHTPQSPNLSASASASDFGASSLKREGSAVLNKLQLFVQLEGAETHKLIAIPRDAGFDPLKELATKKFTFDVILEFLFDDDRVEIDSDETLEMFLNLNPGATKHKLFARPAKPVQQVAAVAVAAGSALGKSVAPPPQNRPNSPPKVNHHVKKPISKPSKAVPPRPANPADDAPLQPARLRTPKVFQETSAVYCVSFSPTGMRFVTGNKNGEVLVWNAERPDLPPLEMKGGHKGQCLSCCFSPLDDEILSGGDDGDLKLWSAENGKKKLDLKGHKGKIFSCAFSKDGNYKVSAGNDSIGRIWDGSKCSKLQGHTDSIFSICFGTTPKALDVIATGSSDLSLRLWDRKAAREIRCMLGHKKAIWGVRFSSKDDMLVSCSMDCDIIVWDFESGAALKIFTAEMEPVHDVLFTAEDRYLISCSRDWSISIWNFESGEKVETLTGHRQTVYHLSMVRNQLLSCSFDETVKLWTLPPLL